MTDESIAEKVKKLMNTPEQIRNLGVAAHIDRV